MSFAQGSSAFSSSTTALFSCSSTLIPKNDYLLNFLGFRGKWWPLYPCLNNWDSPTMFWCMSQWSQLSGGCRILLSAPLSQPSGFFLHGPNVSPWDLNVMMRRDPPPPFSTVIVLHPPLPPGRAGWIHCLSHCRGRPEQRWGEHEQSLLIITWLFHRSSINRDCSPLLYQTCSAALGKLQIPQLCQIKSKPFSWYKYIKSTVVFVAVCQSSAVCPTTDWISLQEARF